MNNPSNILIIRLSAIGDVVMASPLIQAFRRSYPEARLSWLVEPAAKGLLEHNPALDEVILWPRGHWQQLWRERRYLTLWREIRRFTQALRARNFDLVVDVQGLMKSGIWARLSGAPQRIGLGSKEGSHRLMTQVMERRGDDRRIGSEYFHLARELGLELADFAMELMLSADDDRYAGEIARFGDYAVICPFTTRPQKHWVEARWPVLADEIMARFSLPVVMLGGPADRAAAARISAANSNIVNLVGECSLTQSAAMIKHARLLVGVDTGLTHMGIAFNVPTVALFGSTCPYLDTTHANATVIYHPFECSPCRRRPSCDGRFDCMAAINTEEVAYNAARMIDAGMTN